MFHKITRNYAVDIVLLTLTIKSALFPFTLQQFRFSRLLAKIQPELKKLEKIKKQDPKKYQVETMKLYEQYGVNPFAGCLPLLLQIPVFIALFSLLRNPNINQGVFDTATFLGMPLYMPPMVTLMDLGLETEYIDTEVQPGIRYQYRIEPVRGGKKLGAEETSWGWAEEGKPFWKVSVERPLGLQRFSPVAGKTFATDGSWKDKVLVQWHPFPQAKEYRVYRWLPAGEKQLIHTEVPRNFLGVFRAQPQTFFVDANLPSTGKMGYQVVAVLPDGTSLYFLPDTGYPGSEKMEVEHISQGEYQNAVRIRWRNRAEVEGYHIYRRAEGKETYKKVGVVRPDVPAGSLLHLKKSRENLQWQVFYLPAWILLLLYLSGQLFYQRQYRKLNPPSSQSPYLNPNVFLLLIVLIAVSFPVGLLLYFLTYSGAGIIENEVIYRVLHPGSKRERKLPTEGGKSGGSKRMD
ncbi:MAG: membrane protein insertase YidC [bacterium JZ-2024 1]